MFRRTGRTAVRVFAGPAFALFLIAPVARAGILGPDSNTTVVAAPKAAKPKPYSPVATTAEGACNITTSHCPDTPCASGHSCDCVAFSGFPMKFPGAGATTMSAEINLDQSIVIHTGTSICLVAYGFGVGTVKSGASTITVFFNGQICGNGGDTDATGGTWLVPTGSGALNKANGTGFFSISHSDGFGSSPCVITMNGTFRKTP